ncbi:T9SS type A sorting domain-containing protein [Hymenobacter rubripertinctus]|uniref:T9SS C-terminal target domain-containing protein n=1 Tax=Hymenobacter rubripertinctus TaxID=2029981 RepID=A0A418QXZ0_9BACT|nr:T9SS type A sorting domain-containing protein [Hymenobacter rubripertinctus]RIY10022.1 T9SS C-terminal target domain-containing protein [Hymenobacter rubripertinctus]
MMPLLRVFFLFALLAVGLPSSLSGAHAQAAARPAPKPSEEKALLVFPNPSTGIVHIAINGFEGRKLELRVLNVIGTVMYRETLTELNERYTRTLDLSKFANGLYYVKLEADNASEMRKLVIR